MAAITIETSFAAMNRDMGQSHIEAHAKQHKYLMDGEDPIDYLLPDDEVTPIVEQAIQAGVKSGQLRSESEWEEYNKSIRKDRRLDSYFGYVQKVCSTTSKKLYRDFDKALQNPKTPKSKRSMIATEFNALASHKDIPIIGNLLYFGDAHELEMAKQEGYFEQLKQADKEAGNAFIHSKEFKCLHPQTFKIERHNDEMGRPHLQTMESCFTTHTRDYKTKTGTVRRRIDDCGKTQYLLNGLIRYFGSKEKVDQQLDRLIELQQHSQDAIKKNHGKRIGLERPETSMLMDNFDPKEAKLASDKIIKDVKPSTLNKMRRQTIATLARVIDFSAMARAKAKAYKQEKLPPKYYQTNVNYTTDGKHLTAHQYRLKMAAQDKGKATIKQAKSVAEKTKKAAQDDADDIVKAAHKKAKNIVDEAQAKEAEAKQAKNEALYEQARINHQNHLAEIRLADLNKRANNTETKLNQQHNKHEQLIKENNQLVTEVKHNRQIVKSIAGLQRQAKTEGLSANAIIADRSKLTNQIHLMGKAYEIMEKTAKLAIALMTGKPLGYKDTKRYKESAADRAFSSGITLNNYENEFTTTAEKKSMDALPIILTKKAAHWLARKYEAKFHKSPFADEQTNNSPNNPQQPQKQITDERTPD